MQANYRCSRCPREAVLDLSEVHEPNRVCPDCKSPWQPADYQGRLIAENTLITPEMAWEWLLPIEDTAGHWYIRTNTKNLRRYIDDMKNGYWERQLLGFPGALEHAVTFDPHGRMLMGVIRCIACVAADSPFEAIVQRITPINIRPCTSNVTACSNAPGNPSSCRSQ